MSKIIEFEKLNTIDDLSALFDMTYKELSEIVYSTKDRYTTFKILKKNGEKRTISKPNNKLRLIQKKLSELLLESYPNRPSVHGFVKGRSVVSGAQKHLDKQSILNIDLLNFFDSIHFGRVKYLFISYPFHFSENIATILAHISCHKNKLPQGAPTSPIISNMICFKLDRQLQNLAKKGQATYTRYADDISFSFTVKSIRIKKIFVEDVNELILSSYLRQIIESNGFKINEKKIRIYNKNQRMLITGIKVNEFTNVQRKYINKIKSMLYAWEKHGYNNAKMVFQKTFLTERHKHFYSYPEYKNVIRGKLNYLKMVRGDRDNLYIKYAKWFNVLIDEFAEKHLTYTDLTSNEDNIKKSLFVIEILYDSTDGIKAAQGTGFFLKNIGIITCAHVVIDEKKVPFEEIVFFTHDNHGKKEKCQVSKIDIKRDLAILKPLNDKFLDDFEGLEYSLENFETGENVKLIGFPAYKLGQTLYIVDTKIATTYGQHGISKFEIDKTIREGNSGGPVLNENNKVIGIASEGAEKSGGNNAVIRIKELFDLLKQT